MDKDLKTRRVWVRCTWSTCHAIDLPEGEDIGPNLGAWADQVDSAGADLVDWAVERVEFD